jgi:HK97 family phage prohead protease
MDGLERRSLAVESASQHPLLRVESRCDCEDDGDDGREWIVGYAAKFGVNSLEIDGEFIERIDPGAFSLVTERRGRRKPLETRALFNHNADMPLAKYPRTLKLYVDDIGLRYEFPVPSSSYGKDLAANVRDGIVTGSSFSFTVGKGGDDWSMEEGRSVRVIKRVDSLIDVGPVTFPAYPDADAKVAMRSYDRWRSAGVSARDGLAVRDRLQSRRVEEMQKWLAGAELRHYMRTHGLDIPLWMRANGR